MAATTLSCMWLGHVPFTALKCIVSIAAGTELWNMSNLSAFKRPTGTAQCGHISWLLNVLTYTIPAALLYKSYNMTNTDILLVFSVVWAADTAGLLVGQYIRGPLLTEWSPKKTVSGLYGALIFGTICGCLFQYLKGSFGLSYFQTIKVACLCFKIAVSSQIGDFLESVCKRHCGLKDSNYLFCIPGHGGILDRIDGLIFSIIMF